MTDRTPCTEVVLTSVRAIIDSSLHDGGTLSLRDLDFLRSLDQSRYASCDFESRRLILAGRLMAYSRNGDVRKAHRLALHVEKYWPQPGDCSLTGPTSLALTGAIVEAFLGAGDPIRAVPWVTRMAQVADELDDPRWLYRAEGMLAVTRFLNGDWDQAEQHLANGERVARRAGWPDTATDFMHSAATALSAFLRLDARTFRDVAGRVRRLAMREPTSGDLAELCEAMALLLTGRAADASEIANRIQQGTLHPTGPLLIRTFAVYLESLLQLRAGRPLLALNAISEEVALEKHLLCPGVLSGAAMIQMGDYAGALAETSLCAKLRTKHAQWSYPLILAVRAIALSKTGHTALALVETLKLRRCARIAIDRLTLLPWILPQAELLDLLEFSEERSFWQAQELSLIRSAILRIAQDAPDPIKVQSFTRRERIVAHQLRGEASFAEIAEKLFVSRGTITAQSSSIYRKLGVSGRAEAVQYLEGTGFFESSQ